MTRLLLAALLGACCPTPAPATPHTGSGSGSATPDIAGCEAARAKVEQLYRAEAEAKEPKRVAAATADNVAMAMTDCAKAPAKVGACLATAASTSDIETRCLAPLDEEGTEGDDLAHPHH